MITAVFTARAAKLALQALYMPRAAYPSVCPSVCLSVTFRYCITRAYQEMRYTNVT